MEPIDLQQAARSMLQLHGTLAPQACHERAEQFAAADDIQGQITWEAIRYATLYLLQDGWAEIQRK